MRSFPFLVCAASAVSAVAFACGSTSVSPGEPTPSSTGTTTSTPSSTSSTPTSRPDGPSDAAPRDANVSDATGADASEASPVDAAVDAASAVVGASCKTAGPAGTPRALPLPLYAGTCPTIAAAPAYTELTSSGATRKFLVYKPTTAVAGEVLPVVFLWHWLGGSPEDVVTKLSVQTAVDLRRFVAVIPAPKGDALFRWPFEATQSQARVDEEAAFFDDMLACVGKALPVEKECVSSVGVSAGALWTSQLATVRSQRLASIVSLSGGVGDVVRPWTQTPHRLPALVLWGGATDSYPSQVPIMNFDRASKKLESALATDGHFMVECIHNCGHAVPPFDPPPAGALQFDAVWRFVLDHPYWLGAGQSPYATQALPAGFPSWCGKGQGSATARPAGSACN
jgi:poly(3-hydroxybutyrate) depolymerase